MFGLWSVLLFIHFDQSTQIRQSDTWKDVLFLVHDPPVMRNYGALVDNIMIDQI